MKARVLKAFRHVETGRIWLKGEMFDGDAKYAADLVSKGFIEGPANAKRDDGMPPLASLTVRELQEICEKKGVETPRYARKSDLIAALEAVG